jgi:hypothetical protein
MRQPDRLCAAGGAHADFQAERVTRDTRLARIPDTWVGRGPVPRVGRATATSGTRNALPAIDERTFRNRRRSAQELAGASPPNSVDYHRP